MAVDLDHASCLGAVEVAADINGTSAMECISHSVTSPSSEICVATALPPRSIKNELRAEPTQCGQIDLRLVASQAYLLWRTYPSGPNHLRSAQPRAQALEVRDESTSPLCRGHHRQLHQAGKEIVWWKNLNIDALSLARQLWEQTHPNEGQSQTTTVGIESNETNV